MKILLACLMLVFSLSVNADSAGYDFKKGHWQIEAKTMNPDQSHSKGTGYGYVYQNQVGLVQDNLCIDMEGVPDVIGTTLRSYDENANQWNVRWLAYGASSGIGAGVASEVDGVVVESFAGEDGYGSFIDEMKFTIHSEDHYVANLSRTYPGGNITIDCIWCYEAKRSKANTDSKCELIK